MSNWTATNELRFEAREQYGEDDQGMFTVTRLVLQQKWHLAEYIEGEGWQYSKTEWRDVPVVEEE